MTFLILAACILAGLAIHFNVIRPILRATGLA